MKLKLMAAGAAAFLMLASPGFAQDAGTPSETSQAAIEAMSKVTTAKDFVMNAAMSDMFEIQTGQMAQKQAGSNTVRELGQMLVKDHSAASKKLMTLAAAAKVEAGPPEALDQRHQLIVDSLKDAKGAGFDKAFLQAQVEAHQEAIALFEAYGKNGDNAELKNFANEGLPKLKHHLEMAQKAEMAPATQ